MCGHYLTRLKFKLLQSLRCPANANLIVTAILVLLAQQAGAVTPFKLATYKNHGDERPAIVCGDNLIDIAGASQNLDEAPGSAQAGVPENMRELIENYELLKPRLYEISDEFCQKQTKDLPFIYPLTGMTLAAPIKYPYNLLAAAANYLDHAEEMNRVTDYDVSINPETDAPYLFAKSARSSIIDPGEPYYIPAGRDKIDWEGELAIVIGKPAKNVSMDQVHDYVFGYSIIYDVSDRGKQYRQKPMLPGPDWFSSKSRDGAAPFGPYIVPKEFLPDHDNLRLITRLNGEVVQDGNTGDMIFNEARLLSFVTSILTLYPGDVIATGTPAGVGSARRPQRWVKPGDVVEIEIEGIGTLVTPIKAEKQ